MPDVYTPMTNQNQTVPPFHGDKRARLLRSEILTRVKALAMQATTYPDSHVDCALVRETIALLRSLLPVTPGQDKQSQVDMAAQHHARADARESFERLWDNCNAGKIGDYEAVTGALERARVVGVLDARAAAPKRLPFFTMLFPDDSGWLCTTREEYGPEFEGATPDAARAAAAKAIEAGEV